MRSNPFSTMSSPKTLLGRDHKIPLRRNASALVTDADPLLLFFQAGGVAFDVLDEAGLLDVEADALGQRTQLGGKVRVSP
jgi:hypothetical protein